MGDHRAEVRRDPPDEAGRELERRRGEVEIAERRALGRDAVPARRDADGALAGDPEHEVDEVAASAEKHRVVLDVAAPAVGDLVEPAVEVVAVEGVDGSEASPLALLACETKEWSASEHEVRREHEFGVLRDDASQLPHL